MAFWTTLNAVVRPRMLPPLPASNESDYSRFKRFAGAILAVPRSEIPIVQEAVSKLKAKKQKVDSKVEVVRRERQHAGRSRQYRHTRDDRLCDVWWLWKKHAEKRLIDNFERGLRFIQVSLYTKLEAQYSATMEQESAKVLAAQVTNYLKGDDVGAVMQSSIEPLKSKIARIEGLVPVSAANAMDKSVSTREVIVATLRMRAFLEFMLQGETYFHGDQHKRMVVSAILCKRRFS